MKTILAKDAQIGDVIFLSNPHKVLKFEPKLYTVLAIKPAKQIFNIVRLQFSVVEDKDFILMAMDSIEII